MYPNDIVNSWYSLIKDELVDDTGRFHTFSHIDKRKPIVIYELLEPLQIILKYDNLADEDKYLVDPCTICRSSDHDSMIDKTFMKYDCGHIYHTSCHIELLKNTNSCPMCRSPIYDKVIFS